MKIILLTSESLRHKYIAAQLAEDLQLELVITEKKSAAIQDTSKLSKEDAAFVAEHFEARNRSEIHLFGNYKEFPKEVPQLKMPHGSINSHLVKTLVDNLEPDYLVLFGTSILKDPLLKKYSGRIINLHLGLSPFYKGSATNLFPYGYNEPECVGATIHLATSNVDEGPVLHQLRPDIESGDDLHSIGNKTIFKAGKILPEIIKGYAEKEIVPQKQNGTGRICRNKDLTPTLLREIYKKFKNGLIEEYLREKKTRDGKKPLLSFREEVNENGKRQTENGKQKTMIIAEIAQAHEGSLGVAHSYIDALAKAGVDAVKFQVHIAEAESSKFEPFRIKFSTQDTSRFDYWKRMEFSLEQWKELKSHCDEAGVEFMASPFSIAAVDLLEKLEVNRYKIGSGEVNNFLMLEKIAATGKPLILSSGMSSFEELDRTVEFLQKKNVKYSILQCTTSYPTEPQNYGLNVIGELKERYNVPIGYSDHSAKIETCIAATALGAEILEFHAVFSREMFGPDAGSSLEMEEIKQLVSAVKNIHQAQQHPINKQDNSNFKELKSIFEKSLAVNKELPAGHVITFDDLESKKPKEYGIDASEFETVIGKKLTRNLGKWEFLNNDDLMM